MLIHSVAMGNLDRKTLELIFNHLPINFRYMAKQVCRKWYEAFISNANSEKSLTIDDKTNVGYEIK